MTSNKEWTSWVFSALLIAFAIPAYAQMSVVVPNKPQVKMTPIPIADAPTKKKSKKPGDACLSEGVHCDLDDDQCCPGLECDAVANEDTICLEQDSKKRK